ncbi:MAG TPA: single-stranded-DNA-specific exonuclease RecJ [Thermomicrobiales bacterium]|nr:single-stranded-DNA-specific exonuclease RecJ [Thermomicrobiales bacterium]
MTALIDKLRPSLTPHWIEPTALPDGIELGNVHANPLLARILWQRGIRDVDAARAFTNSRSAAAPSPWLLPNMESAVERVADAIDNREKVAIFGDYDADGVTSSVLLTRALRPHLGVNNMLTILPERADGYGVSLKGVGEAARFGASLLITVDCGSSDHQALDAARKAGIDVVVLDHHRINGDPPEHAIVVSPQLGDDERYRDLTGVGVAWLLVSALAQNGVPITDPPARTERAFLDLVAIGTVADVSPLIGINRSIVRDGIAVLRRSIRPGLRAMTRVADRDIRSMTAADIAFTIAPRLNAAGRLGSPTLAYDLLMEEDPARAETLALEVERINRQRKSLATSMLQKATERILANPDWEDWPILIAHDPSWQAGMVGTIAAKITEASGRPSILFEECEDGVLKGSARSIPGVNIGEILNELDHLLIRHGGHSGAAGVSVHRDRLDEFAEELAMLVLAADAEIPAPALLPIDADLTPEDLSQETVLALGDLEPCGRGNDIPNLRIAGARVAEYTTIGNGGDHLKVRAQHGDRSIECVFWNAAHRSGELMRADRVDLVGTLGVNTWRDRSRLQFDLKDFRASP